VFYICFYHLFYNCITHSTLMTLGLSMIVYCIVFSLNFVLSCVCQLVLKNYDDYDDDALLTPQDQETTSYHQRATGSSPGSSGKWLLTD